jgi:hypothetical protein
VPKSVLAKACNYTLTLWTRLTRFLEHPVLELSNNLAENAMRPVALGRSRNLWKVAEAKVWSFLVNLRTKFLSVLIVFCLSADCAMLIDRNDLPISSLAFRIWTFRHRLFRGTSPIARGI